MSSASILNTMYGYDVSGPRPGMESSCDLPGWDVRRFEQDQIRSLVQQIFFPGGLKTPRQVVFSGVDQNANVAEICLHVGRALAIQSSGGVCIVEMSNNPPPFEAPLDEESPARVLGRERFDTLRDPAFQISKKLWLVPADTFLRNEKSLSTGWLRGRLDELRLDLDYTIFHSPAVGQCSDALLMGHLCDGVVLVLTANSTRRIAARKVKDRLFSANARLLGTVLNNRSFPIPEGLYRRL